MTSHVSPLTQPVSTAVTPGLWSASSALAWRELLRFFRQRTRIVGAIGQPIIFWLLFGAGLRGSFQAPDWAAGLAEPLSYQEYFFPGIAVLIVMFTAIFSTISIIEDRREGFLQGVLAAPVSRSVIVLGKVLGGTLLAVIQAGLFLLVGPLLSVVGLSPALQIDVSVVQGMLAAAFLTLIAVELTALGFVMAWPLNSTQGFHALMSIFLMPMWLVSGAFFPGGGGDWLSWLIRLNPLTYGVAGLRRLLYAGQLPVTDSLPSLPMSIAVTAGFATLCFLLCVRLVSRPMTHNVT
ncbi:MAG: ABC transporter permease [Planctomycetaceae bacterium]